MSLMRLVYRTALAASAVLGVSLSLSATAGAETFVFGGSFGSFEGPRGVAVDNSKSVSAGDVYVTNFSRVMKFSAAGTELGELKFTPTPAQEAEGLKESGSMLWVTVDPVGGDVYASSFSPAVVTEFGPTGAFASQIGEKSLPEEKAGKPVIRAGFAPGGVTVAPSAGELYVADRTNNVIDRFSTAGEYETQFPTEGPTGFANIAAGPSGAVFVTEQEGAVREFSASGAPVITPPCATNVIDTTTPQNVAVDPSNGAVFVGENAGSAAFDIARYSPPCAAATTKFGEGHFGEAGSYGIAISSSHTVYASSLEHGDVNVFNPVGPPLSVTGSAKSIEPTSAQLCGTVNPKSETLSASYQFRYGLSEGYGEVVPASPASIGTGEKAIEACATAENLLPGRTYHFQIVGSNSEGSAPGGDQRFTTPPAKPTVLEQAASLIQPREAILTAMLNDGNGATEYHFVYGLTSNYGSRVPLGDLRAGASAEAQKANRSLTGLQPSSTYHFALVASNATGTTIGPDATFTTTPAASPIVLTGAAGEVSQNSATLTGTVDPRGLPTGYEFDLGTDTNYGARVFGDAGSGSEPLTVVLSVQGLAAGTTYHYRLAAKNTYGTVYGADRTFTTPGFPTSLIAPPLVPTLVPTPAFSPPSIAGAVTVKAVKPAKKKKTKTKRRGKKATRAIHRHANRRNG
jgi:hypothetical protein